MKFKISEKVQEFPYTLHSDSPTVGICSITSSSNTYVRVTANIKPLHPSCVSVHFLSPLYKESLLHNHRTDIRSRKCYFGLDNSLVPKSILRFCQLPPIMSFIAVCFLVQDSYHISFISFNLKRMTCFK